MNTNQIKKQQLLETLYAPYTQCIQCPLGELGRSTIVFGQGNPDAQLMILGEAPGREEDRLGKPFVGKSGALLNKIFELYKVKREDFFITNIVKCRPPGNRRPLPKEMMGCKKLLLLKQIEIIQPKVICTLGSAPLEGLFERPIKITKERGKIILFDQIKIVPTYHPAYILRNPKELTALAHDMQLAIRLAYE